MSFVKYGYDLFIVTNEFVPGIYLSIVYLYASLDLHIPNTPPPLLLTFVHYNLNLTVSFVSCKVSARIMIKPILFSDPFNVSLPRNV